MAKKDERDEGHVCQYPLKAGSHCQNPVEEPTARCPAHEEAEEPPEATENMEYPPGVEEALQEHFERLLAERDEQLEKIEANIEIHGPVTIAKGNKGDVTVNKSQGPLEQLIGAAGSIYNRIKSAIF